MDLIEIAEANPAQAGHLKYILENNNYNVIVGKDGEEALCQIKKHETIITKSLIQGNHY